MYILRDYHEQIDRFICSRSRQAFVVAWVLLSVMLALLGAIFFWMGAPPIEGIPWDPPMFLDGAWRIINGQTPHKDFYSEMGVLPFYVALLGMKLGRPGVSAIACGNVFVMVTVGLAAMTVLQRRTSAFYACLFSLFLVFLAVAPRPLGAQFHETTYAMVYNRYGEAFLALLGALLFLRPEPLLHKNWADWVEAGFAGLCLPLLLACKLNYFAVGTGFFVLACLLGRFPVKQALFAVVSAAACFTLGLFLTKIPFSAMWGDYRIMLAAQDPGYRLHRLASLVGASVVFFAILLFLAWEVSRKHTETQRAWRPFFLVTVIFGSELLLVASNFQPGVELPLLALAAWYGAETIRRQARVISEERFFIAMRNLNAAFLLLFFLLPTLIPDLASIRYSAHNFARRSFVTPDSLQSTPMDDFRFVVDGGIEQAQKLGYIARVDEGMQLLRRHSNPQMRLAVFLHSNPFQIALRMPPAEGGVICWSKVGIAKRSHPPLRRLVGNATYILTGGGSLVTGLYEGDFKDLYGAEWDALHFEVVEQTKDYTLFKVPEVKENNLQL